MAASTPGALAHFCVDESTGELQQIPSEESAPQADLNLDGASMVRGIIVRGTTTSAVVQLASATPFDTPFLG